MVPNGIRQSGDLFAAFNSALSFPAYFGYNWDAFEECLRDLSWISEQSVKIVHRDMPLQADPAQCKTYLSILADLAEVHADQLSRCEKRADGEDALAHLYVVTFPSSVRQAIERIVSS